MNFPTIKTICICLSAALAATGAQAVHISPNGTGQVLLFPYYTVRNGFATLVSVTNTQNNTKAVKVRFLEGMNGREVKSFNLFLAADDTWTAAVVETADGAKMMSNDNSCVTPADLFAETRKIQGGQGINEFFNFSYTGTQQDAPAPSSLDRTREGYFEIVEMGVIDATLSASAAQIVGFVKPDVFTNATSNCAAMDSFDNTTTVPSQIRFPNIGAALMVPPRGGLKGRASLINAATGANYSYSPTVLEAWSSQVAYSESGRSFGPLRTLLSDAFPTTSMVTTPGGTIVARWANGRDAVTAALMRESLTNEFVLDAGTASQTEWIVTMPTKPFYMDTIHGNIASSVRAPFGINFPPITSIGCDRYTGSVLNREAFAEGVLVGVTPPGPPGLSSGPILCRMANIIPFNGPQDVIVAPTGLLGSPAPSHLGYVAAVVVARSTSRASPATTPALSGTQGPNGRLKMLFNQTEQRLTPLSAILISSSGTQTNVPGIHFGLPVIGMMLHNYQNANVVSRYGGVIEHGYSVRVE